MNLCVASELSCAYDVAEVIIKESAKEFNPFVSDCAR
jgi:hypothetical protein